MPQHQPRPYWPEVLTDWCVIRALEQANRRWERWYRHFHPRLTPRLPSVLTRWLPAPQMDTTRQTRMRLASLLSRLGPLAESVELGLVGDASEDGRHAQSVGAAERLGRLGHLAGEFARGRQDQRLA